MKNIKTLLQWTGFALLLLVTACTKNENPLTDARDKFEGSWKCTESGPKANATPFTIIITKSGSSSIDIQNFGNLDKTGKVTASVSGSAISISTQSIGGFTVSGTGSYSGSRISLSYKIDSDNLSAVCDKQ